MANAARPLREHCSPALPWTRLNAIFMPLLGEPAFTAPPRLAAMHVPFATKLYVDSYFDFIKRLIRYIYSHLLPFHGLLSLHTSILSRDYWWWYICHDLSLPPARISPLISLPLRTRPSLGQRSLPFLKMSLIFDIYLITGIGFTLAIIYWLFVYIGIKSLHLFATPQLCNTAERIYIPFHEAYHLRFSYREIDGHFICSYARLGTAIKFHCTFTLYSWDWIFIRLTGQILLPLRYTSFILLVIGWLWAIIFTFRIFSAALILD